MLSLVKQPALFNGGISPMKNHLDLLRFPLDDAFEKIWSEFFTKPGLKQSLVSRSKYPKLNVFRDFESRDLVCEATVPGMKKEDVTIEIENGSLIITGKSSNSEETSDKTYYLKEVRGSHFSRSISLPDGYEVKEGSVVAGLDKGILTVRIVDFFPAEEPAKELPSKVIIPIK
jgi:HSP20 family protein